MRGEMPPPPAATTLGISFKNIDAKIGAIEVEFEGKKEFTNPAGNIQGGFLAAMLDDTMGPALASTLSEGEFAPTLNLNVCFQSAAKVGRLLGKGRVVKRGRGVCFLSAELYKTASRWQLQRPPRSYVACRHKSSGRCSQKNNLMPIRFVYTLRAWSSLGQKRSEQRTSKPMALTS